MAVIPPSVAKQLVVQDGLDIKSLTTSYPPPAGYQEARDLLRRVTRSNRMTKEIVVELEDVPENSEVKMKVTTRLTDQFIRAIDCSECFGKSDECSSCVGKLKFVGKDQQPTDEVDGRAEKVLEPLIKLVFLKILLVDIGISLGDVITDFIQGINLIFDNNWRFQFTTAHYGVAILLVPWLPAVVALVHVGFFHHMAIFPKKNCIYRVGLSILVLLFFPLVPTLMYILVLLKKRRFKSNKDKLAYMAFESKAHELKSIAGAIESTIQLILLFWLMLRGILTLPWDEPLSSSCVEDYLGRVACLPSIPVASMIFSLLSILKAMYDMNISPLLSDQDHTMMRMKNSYDLFLRFTPFFLVNVIFRLTSYAFIITYIDFWSVIPVIILFILSLVINGMSFIKFNRDSHRPDLSFPMDNLVQCGTELTEMSPQRASQVEIGSLASDQTLPMGWNGCDDVDGIDMENNVNKDLDEVDAPPALIWNGEEWISRSQHQNQPVGWNVTHHSLTPSQASNQPIGWNIPDQTDQASVNTVPASTASATPSVINEDNTPVFLNSVVGFFFPICYTQVRMVKPTKDNDSDDGCRDKPGETIRLQQLIMWQKKVFRSQIFIFNISITITIVTIFLLVRYVNAFNYKTNILDHFWFMMACVFIFMMFLISTMFTLQPDVFSILEKINQKSTLEEKDQSMTQPKFEMASNKKERERHLTNESNRYSIYSASSNIIKESLGPKRLRYKTIFCLLATVLVISPSIVGLVLFKLVPSPEPYVFFLEHSGSPTEDLKLNIMAAFPSPSFHKTMKTNLLSGPVYWGCGSTSGSDVKGGIVLVNQSDPQCAFAINDRYFANKHFAGNATAIVVLDDTPEQFWRVSSPVYGVSNFPSDIPTLIVRKNDWKHFKENLESNIKTIKLFISKERIDDWKSVDVFECTNYNKVTVSDTAKPIAGDSKVESIKHHLGMCKKQKNLFENGSISENICFKSICWKNGFPCPHFRLKEMAKTTSLNIICQGSRIPAIHFWSASNPSKSSKIEELRSHELIFPGGITSDHCCRNSSHFLRVLGSNCPGNVKDVGSIFKQCQFSPLFEEYPCKEGLQDVAKYCLHTETQCIIRDYFKTQCGKKDNVFFNACFNINHFNCKI